MQKINQLMVDAGISPEAADKLCESVEGHIKSQLAKGEVALQAKMKAVKAVCMEETAKHKVDLAKRVQIFVESKQDQITASARKNAVNEQTDAAAILNKVHNLVSGAEIQGQSSHGDLKRVKSLQSRVSAVTEERDQAHKKANQALAMVDKVMKSSRIASKELQETKEALTKATVLVEGKKAGRIDQNRSNGQQQVTQRTLSENQQKPGAQPKSSRDPNGPYSPNDVARHMS